LEYVSTFDLVSGSTSHIALLAMILQSLLNMPMQLVGGHRGRESFSADFPKQIYVQDKISCDGSKSVERCHSRPQSRENNWGLRL